MPCPVGALSKSGLKALLHRDAPLVAPGVYDSLTALLAEQAGFEALYLSGAGIAYSRLGRPDIGLVSFNEVAGTLSAMRERVALPIVVDADTGFGNALNVQRTVRLLERLGASAIQLEDQTIPKRCGHLAEKRLVSAAEMVGKIKAALDARTSEETLIIGRTDAVSVEGFGAALDRAEAYVAAGCDVLFIESPKSRAHLEEAAVRFGKRLPLMANMVEGGLTPVTDSADLGRLGYSFVIFPGALPRLLAFTARQFLQDLKRDGGTAAYKDRMFDFAGLNAVVGADEILATGKRFDSDTVEDDASEDDAAGGAGRYASAP